MADDKAQTGGEEQRREGLGSSLVNEQEALTGVSNGDQKEIVVAPPTPVAATTTPKTTDGAAAVAPPVQGAAGDEEPDPRAQRTNAPLPPQQAPQTTPTTPKADETPTGDEYSRDKAKTAAAAAAAAEEEEIRDTKKMRMLLNDKWGLQWPDPVLHNIMQKGSVTKGIGGIVFELEDGATIKWHENFMQQGEFVGKTGLFAKISEKDAEAIVAVAKNRGWSKLNVYGSREQREMLWLEAKKQGVEVGNFAPTADSPIMQKWAEAQLERANKTLVGVQNADNAPLNVTGEVKPGIDERPGYRGEAAADEPAKAADAPKTIAASTIAGPAAAAAAAAVADPTAATTATPAAAVVETVAAATTPKTPEEIKAFFDAKIEGTTHPKMKEALGRISDKLSAGGVDEGVVKEVCDRLDGCKVVRVQDHNAIVAVINEKLPSSEPLIALGFKPRQGGPGPGMKA